MSGDEARFRTWLTRSGRERGWVMQSIETNTAAGIPDVFFCIDGMSGWMELKVTDTKKHYMRVSQYNWFRRYVKVKGLGFLLIKRTEKDVLLPAINVYNVADLVKIPLDSCRLSGENVVFPADTQPIFSYKLREGTPYLFKTLQQLCKDYVDKQRRSKCKKL